MGKTIALSCLKGGVGKTMTVASLGAGLARQGKRVLCLDSDPQHSLTVSFGVAEPDKLETTLKTMLENIINETDFDPTSGIIHHSEGVDLLPANSSLADMELTLVLQIGRETILRQYIERVKPLYDYVLIDTRPALGLLTVNALVVCCRGGK